MDQLDSDGLIIIKHGKPVARVLSARTESKDLIGSLAGEIRVLGDIESTGIKGDAES